MSTPQPDPSAVASETRLPRLLVIATFLVATQGCFFVAYAILEVLHISSNRVAMGVTTSIFFAAYGALLLASALAFSRRDGWARSPVVLAQFITLLVAWGFRGGETTMVAVVLGAIALVTLVGVFAPSSAEALADQSSRQV